MQIQAVSELSSLVLNKNTGIPTTGNPSIPEILRNVSYIELSYKVGNDKYDSVKLSFKDFSEWINSNFGYLNTKCHDISAKHDTDIGAISSDHDSDIANLSDDYIAKINALETKHNNDKNALIKKIEDLSSDHYDDKADLIKMINGLSSTVSALIDSLNNRIDDLTNNIGSAYLKLNSNTELTVTGPVKFSTLISGNITNADLAEQAKWA